MASLEEPPASPLAIALFGPLDVRLEGRPLPPPRSQRTHWLLALLALQEGRAVERTWLAGTLWPDSTELQAARNLRSSLWSLRQALGPEAGRLQAPTTHTLRLDLIGAEADLLVFDESITRGDPPSLEQAVALHRGPLLQGCDEEWVLQEREAREQAYLGALEQLAAHATARGMPTEAARYLRRLVAADPLRDSGQYALMEAFAAAGDVAAACQVYRDFRLRLHRELNAAPDPAITALYQRIREGAGRRTTDARGTTPVVCAQLTAPTAPGPSVVGGRSPTVARLSPVAGSLPLPASSFIGRERERTELRALLSTARLVTLTGPGGVGKTRLAIEVAHDASDAYAHGVAFVDLVSVADPSLVGPTVARALGVTLQPGIPAEEAVQASLSSRELLLILDNCEHLLDATARLVETMLGHCARLRVLATSRQPLGIAGEHAWRVLSLSLPASGVQAFGPGTRAAGADVHDEPVPDPERLNARTPERLLASEAVRLFVERGAAITRSFALTPENAAAVSEVCRRLDGIPLAIELAAARLQALSAAEIAARLTDRFRLLTRGGRTAPTRQQTLQAAIDWSYDLLTEPERALLRRLSVFVGSFTLEAVEAVVSGQWSVGYLRYGHHQQPVTDY